MANGNVPAWKMGRRPEQSQVNLGSLLGSAQQMRQMRMGQVDTIKEQLDMQYRSGELDEASYLAGIEQLQGRFTTDPYYQQQFGDLAQQQREKMAKSSYTNWAQGQQQRIQSQYNRLDAERESIKDQFKRDLINRSEYNRRMNAVAATELEKGTFELPKYDYSQWAPGQQQTQYVGGDLAGGGNASFTQYTSGRMRDIERENQIRGLYRSMYGGSGGGAESAILNQFAGSYGSMPWIKAALAEGKNKSSLYKDPYGDTVYAVRGGLKRAFSSRDALRRAGFSFSDVKDATPGYLDKFASGTAYS